MHKTIEEFIQKIIEVYHPDRIYIFGSVARNQQDDYSDVDIAVIAESSLPFIKRLRQSIDLLPKIPNIDLLIYTPREFAEMIAKKSPFAQGILNGRIIYEKS